MGAGVRGSPSAPGPRIAVIGLIPTPLKCKIAAELADAEALFLAGQEDYWVTDLWIDSYVLVGGRVVKEFVLGDWTMRELRGRFVAVDNHWALVLPTDPTDAEIERVGWLVDRGAGNPPPSPRP
jgi:hypothetical protein